MYFVQQQGPGEPVYVIADDTLLFACQVDREDMTESAQLAMAKRIVAALNICEGISTDELEEIVRGT